MTGTLTLRVRWADSGAWEECAGLTPGDVNVLLAQGGFDHAKVWNPETTPRAVAS